MFDMAVLKHHIDELMADGADYVNVSFSDSTARWERVIAAHATDREVTITYAKDDCEVKLMFTYNDVVFYEAHSIGILNIQLANGKYITLRN